MDLFFNEISCNGLTEQDLTIYLSDFVKLVAEALRQGVQFVRFEKGLSGVELAYNQTLAQYCYRHSKEPEVKALLAFHKEPYLDKDKEDGFLLVDDFRVRIGNQTISCYGLACALINNSVGIGFHTPGWEGIEYKIDIFKEGEVDSVSPVLCVSSTAHFDDPLFVEWADTYLPEAVPEKSKQIPIDKHIHLSDHHGAAELREFSEKLRKSPYVEEIVNSIDRVSDSKKFIVSMKDDIIEIRLVNEGGYGLAVRTTAKNRRQLDFIARHLEEKYS